MTFFLSNSQADSYFAIASQTSEQTGIPENQRHCHHKYDSNNGTHAACQIHKESQTFLIPQAEHYRTKFTSIFRILVMELYENRCCYIIVIVSVAEESQYLTGSIVHVQSQLYIAQVCDNCSPVHSRISETDCPGNPEIIDSHAPIHCRTDQGDLFSWIHLQSLGKILTEQSLRCGCGQGTSP